MIDFNLWAECDDQESLNYLKKHFEGLEYTLLTGKTVYFRPDFDYENNFFGLIVGAPEICEDGEGIETLQDTLEATETALFLYHHLLSALNFRFAHVAFEAPGTDSDFLFESARTFADGNRWIDLECVINNELYNLLGRPVSFTRFKPGYWWNKYKGEAYSPLFSSDQKGLKEISTKLLPYEIGPDDSL